MGRIVVESVRLNVEIDEIAREMENKYGKRLRAIKKHKEKLNELDQVTGLDEGSKSINHAKAWEATAESLNKLSDSLIIESKRAWQICGMLERKCSATGLDPAVLDKVRVLCKKTEAMAADLLCYTLGRLRQRESS
jgi:hypothetical protein